MHKTTYIFTPSRYIGHMLLAAGILCALLAGSLPAYADSMPGGNVADPAVRTVDLAKPAIVRIITGISGHLSVQFPPTTTVTFPQQNNGSYKVQLSGTGTFISSQGDILTADHVVNPNKTKTLDTDLYNQAAPDIANYMNKNAQPGAAQVTKDQVVTQLSSGQLKATTTYDQPSSTVYLSSDYTGKLTAQDFKSLPAGTFAQVDQIKKESAPDQQDTAIIHVPMTDTPSVQVGASASVQTQDKLNIIGFPGNADVSQNPQSLLTSSVNAVSVSAIKTSDSGTPLIQVDGNVGPGDSGGPALDNQGNIVGIVSFGPATPDGQSSTSFLQASSSAQTLLNGLNLDTKPGKFQQLWSQAFSDYAVTTAGHWSKAQQGFSQLAQNYPQFQAVQPYLSYAQSQAQKEQQATPTAAPQPTATAQARQPQSGGTTSSSTSSVPALALTIGVVAVVVLLMIALFAITLRKRKRTPAWQNRRTPVAPAAELPSNVPSPGKTSPGTTTKGAASVPSVPPAQPGRSLPTAPAPDTMQSTLVLKIWPCGHMNRPNARFCSVCGESAPPDY